MFLLSLTLMLVGFAGVILPFLPGVPLAWLGLFIFVSATHFTGISLITVLIFLGLAIATSILDLIVPSWGAKKYQASKEGVTGALLGSFLGIIFLGLPGIVIGPLIGALLGELLAKRTLEQAAQSAWGAFLGFLAGTLIKAVLILIMLGFLIISLF